MVLKSIILGGAFFLAACKGRGDIDLSKATPLTAEPVANGPAAGQDPNPGTPHGLFSLNPGTWTSFKMAGGAVDPVGTTLSQDFDGDGIANEKETTSNIWVADYPVVESEIVPPVTMKVEVLKTTGSGTTTIDTDLTSDSFESRKNEGSEKFHQDEVNLRTINNGSTTNASSSTTTVEAKAEASGTFFGIGAKASGGVTNVENTTNTTVRQTFEDRPFVNNIDRVALSTKADSAEKKAKDYRKEKRSKQEENYATRSDGGIIRAALYIKNRSVNMPVKLSNILCSLVFETRSGALVPMQSFRLRNDDYSLFEVEVYGNSEFGPYVIELKNLNTVEVENALALGYTPKIFIVDYKMTHVQDSNYRQALSSNFSGDNLKVIEENAKGRTALIKIMYPGYRDMFRVVAFNANLTNPVTGDVCKHGDIDTTSNASVSPGVPMYKLLLRLKCSGIDVQFGHFIYDFTGSKAPPQIYPKVYHFGIKSINGFQVAVPCASYADGTGFDPNSGTYSAVNNVCVVRIADLTEAQLDSLAVWGVFDNGKYFKAGEVAKTTAGAEISFDGASLATCGQPNQPCGIPVLKGIASMVWAGDNYDLVALRMADFVGRQRNFGTNPLETGVAMSFNTKWDLSQLGDYPFDPEVRSTYLGRAGLGDNVELTFNLKDTYFLNPNFGPDMDASSNLAFSEFSYNRQKTTKKFTVEETIDFELSMGLGGTQSHWQNIMRPPAATLPTNYNIEKVSATIDYLEQKFKVTVKLPNSHPLVDSDGLVKLYLRTALSNAYRNSIWPQDYTKTKKYDATLNTAVVTGTTTAVIQVKSGIGAVSDLTPGTDSLKIVTDGVVHSYPIPIAAGVIAPTAYGYDITVSSTVATAHKAGDRVYVDAGLVEPQVVMQVGRVNDTDNFFSAFSSQFSPQHLLTTNGAVDCSSVFAPTRCYGYGATSPFDFIVNNYAGNTSFHNLWADARQYANFFEKDFDPYLSKDAMTRIGSWGLVYSKGFKDFPVNTTSISASSAHPQVGIAGDRTLIVWSGDSGSGDHDIWGRLIDSVSGAALGYDFLLSTTSASNQQVPKISVSPDRALVVWESFDNGANHDIRGRVMDLTTGLALGNDFLISTTNAHTQAMPQIAIVNNRALVTWMSLDNGANYDIRGRIFDLATGIGVGSDFVVSTSNAGNQTYPDLAIFGNRALVVWHSTDNGPTADIRGRVVDLGTSLGVGNDFLVNTSNAGDQVWPKIAISGNRAFVAWLSNDSGANYDIRGRVVDLTTLSGISNDFLVSTTNPNDQINMKLAISGDRALAIWESIDTPADYNIRGRVIDLQSGLGVGNDFLVSTTNTSAQERAQLAVLGNRALVIWQSNDNTVTSLDIRGRIVDLSNGAGVGNDFLVSATNTSLQQLPCVAASGHRALAAWMSFDNPGRTVIRGRQFSLTPDYGLNNFFTAPLIERNYTATARIVK